MERRDLLTVKGSHILHHLAVGRVVNIHIRYKHHAGQLILVTQLPGLLRSHFHAGLTGNHDDGRIGSSCRFLHLAYEIKKTGSIKYINLHAFPFDRNHRRAD